MQRALIEFDPEKWYNKRGDRVAPESRKPNGFPLKVIGSYREAGNKMKEIWKPINGYEERYEVSNLGNVASLKYARGSNRRILKQSKNTWGYSQVTLSKNKAKKNVAVHRLVAEAFVDNPKALPQVNHKDENKNNNRADNLEWCDSSYNINYGERTVRVSNTLKRPVIATLPDGTEEHYASVQDAAAALGVSHSAISNAIYKLNRHKRCKDREWRFADYGGTNEQRNKD